jgi:hypothetical protein
MDELKEHGSDDEASDVEWNGDVPDDAKPWCKALHGLITRALGDDCKGSGEPEWWSENDDLFIELEEERREMPRGSLQPFLRQPYHSGIPITEYTRQAEMQRSRHFSLELQARSSARGRLSRYSTSNLTVRSGARPRSDRK